MPTTLDRPMMGVATCCAYFASALLMLISGIAFLSLLVTYFPYIRTFFYEEGTCMITTTITSLQYACECGPNCKAFYPCMLIYAVINDSKASEPERHWPVMVFDDDWQQIRVHSMSRHIEERCTKRVCAEDYKTNAVIRPDALHPLDQYNRDEISRYRLEYGVPHTFHTCYYDPTNQAPQGAVFHRRIPWTLALHVILWPSLGFLLGVLFCAIVCFHRRKAVRSKRRKTRASIHA